MKISYNWLKDYIKLNLTPNELEEKLSLTGLEVEDMEEAGFNTKNIFVGLVTSCEQHPNADKLKICTVDYGTEEEANVICGAPNVAKGQKIPFAAIGTQFPNGLKIKKIKLRGVESCGMICSKQELGIDDDHSGIWVLREDAKIGTPLVEYLNSSNDYIYDISITPNRPDCLSHIGVAREIAALTKEKLNIPKFEINESKENIEKHIDVKIEDIEGCARYACRIIKNVVIKESPQWLKEKLQSVGLRSINNVVDITNFVLLECNQPLHAFDYDRLKGKKINVRFSKINEEFTTLDDVNHKLPPKSIMICDNEKPVALGGIMGGANSEVSSETKNILLEAAYFNPVTINKTSKNLKINTDASHRFERGTDPNGIEYALNRAASLIKEYGDGEILKGIIDEYPNKVNKLEIPVSIPQINKIIGINFTLDEVSELIKPLGIENKNGKFIIPTFRPDIERNADIAEEVARIYGYDNIPKREITEINYDVKFNEYDDFVDQLKIKISEMGFLEVVSNSMGRTEIIESITGQSSIKILNPVSQDLTSLRNSLIPSMLEIVKNNINRQNKDLRLFEINNIFIPKEGANVRPIQEQHLCVCITGNRNEANWSEKNNQVDFYDIKGIAEDILCKISLDNYNLFCYDNFVGNKESLSIEVNEAIIGFITNVKSSVLENLGINQQVFLLNINLQKAYTKISKEKKYKSIPKYPSTERDIAIVVKKEQNAKDILDFIYKNSGNFLKNVVIFDRFTGKPLESDEQSLAFKMIYQSSEKTLTDEEVNKVFQNLIKKITKKFTAKLRQ